MAKKAKKSVKKQAVKSNGKTSKQEYLKIAAKLPGSVPATVGEHFRARIVQGKLENEAIVKEVKSKHKGSTAKMSDLYWNRQYLKNHDGIALKS